MTIICSGVRADSAGLHLKAEVKRDPEAEMGCELKKRKREVRRRERGELEAALPGEKRRTVKYQVRLERWVSEWVLLNERVDVTM